MPWLAKSKAVLDTFYGGDQAGVAQAELLLGKVNPSGRLPFTWPKRLDQEVAHQGAHPERNSNGVDAAGKVCSAAGGGPNAGTACKTTYSEGLNIGYRYFDAANETPLYPFGYGLSYTKFGYSALQTAAAPDGGLDVTFSVTNNGSVAGTAVPQVYLGAPATVPSGVQFAKKALAAYDRVSLAAGQTKTVTLHVRVRQLQYWSDVTGWTLATGARTVYLGSDERTDAAQVGVTIG
jgi:beta-glucosidase